MSDSAESTAGGSHDTIQEAIERSRHEKQSAYGEVDGEDVLVVSVVDTVPKLHVYAGGKYEAYTEPEVDDEYVGGETITRSFNTVSDLRVAFSALQEKYDLQEVKA